MRRSSEIDRVVSGMVCEILERSYERLRLLVRAVDRSQELPDRPKLEGEGENFELGATEAAKHRIDFEGSGFILHLLQGSRHIGLSMR